MQRERATAAHAGPGPHQEFGVPVELHTIVENHNRKQIAPRFELCSVCAPILARGPEGLQLFRTPVVQEPQTGERRRGARLRAAAVPARLNSTRTSSAQPVQTHSKGTRRGCAQPPLETTARNAGGPKRIATQHIWNSPNRKSLGQRTDVHDCHRASRLGWTSYHRSFGVLCCLARCLRSCFAALLNTGTPGCGAE